MSVVLPVVNLAAAVTGTTDIVDWASRTGQSAAPGGSPAHLLVFNESQCEIQFAFPDGNTPFLPSGGWMKLELNPSVTNYTYLVVATLTGQLVSILVTVWYGPGEPVPEIYSLGNSPIGGSFSNLNAQILQGAGQTLAVTTADGGSSGTGPELIPTAATAILGLEAKNAGTPKLGLEVKTNGGLFIPNRVEFYNNDTVFGNGLPGIVDITHETLVTSTAQQNFASYSNGAQDTLLLAVGYARVANGTSGNLVTFGVSYTNPQGDVRTAYFLMQENLVNATILFSGTPNVPNATYSGMVELISLKAGNTATVVYRDPTNTPSDTVSCLLLRVW
jgi:hypothetical protein